MMKELRSVLLVCSFVVLMTTSAYAENVLQNPSFEQYDSVTLIPDNWYVGEGAVEVMSNVDAHDGAVFAGNLGGEWPLENPPMTGTLYQVVDLSTIDNWQSGNWLLISMSAFCRNYNGTKVEMLFEWLPGTYDQDDISWDDPAWSGPDIQSGGGVQGYSSGCHSWKEMNRGEMSMPCVRWMRVCISLDATWDRHCSGNEFTYFVGIDSVSVEVEVFIPPVDDPDNLLLNSGFEDYDAQTLIPDFWHVLDGSVTSMWHEQARPYNGNSFAGNIGGYTTENPDPEGDPIDHPNPPMTGTIVQIIDLSNLENWEDSNFISFSFSGSFISYHTGNTLNAIVEYIPETYNDQGISEDDPVWNSEEVGIAVNLTPWRYSNGVYWVDFATEQGSMPHVRWVRVRLDLDANLYSSYSHDYIGPYLTGVDSICFKAAAVTTDNLVRNPSFEDYDEDQWPYDWHLGDGAVYLLFEPVPAYDGDRYLGNNSACGTMTGTVYQALDLSTLPYWNVIDPETGNAVIYQFIKLEMSAFVSKMGGTSVALGLELLPYSYNERDDITWDDPAWDARAWRVQDDGQGALEFVNDGGDVVNPGIFVKDENSPDNPLFEEMSLSGWIPRMRWARLLIEFDSSPGGQVGIDLVSLTGLCREFGPYSGYGPDLGFWENPDAIDKGVAGWVGPEGEGVCGGYYGLSDTNYVNPAYAGFADDVINYLPSGQIGAGGNPMYVTGRPGTDANWSGRIVILGDMELYMLADYFSETPSGDYHPGEITAVFNESPIVNGPGPDFAGFENGFVLGWGTPYVWAELCFVEVSSNGEDFVRMPSHSLTPYWPGGYGCLIPQGIFGLVGKHVNAYGGCWGTPFDLDWIVDDPKVLDGTVDLNDIRYVRLIDIPGGGPKDSNGEEGVLPAITSLFLDSHGLPVFDAWWTYGTGGADLDAVAVLNSSAPDPDGDHITDHWDNCSETENPRQYDSDRDGYGNMCDCDLDNDDVVAMSDYFSFKSAFGSHGPDYPEEGDPASDNWNPDADFDSDNHITMSDYFIFKNRFGSSAPFK